MVDEYAGIIEENGDWNADVRCLERYAKEIYSKKLNIQHVFGKLESMGIPLNFAKCLIHSNLMNEIVYELIKTEYSNDPNLNLIDSVISEVNAWSKMKEDLFDELNGDLEYIKNK